MPFSAHASACAILAFADGGSQNSSLHPPTEALGISTLAQGSRGGSRRRAQISLGAQIVLKADAQAVFPMLTVLMPYSQNKKSRLSINRKTGINLAVPLSLANCPKLILPCNGGEPVCFYLRGVFRAFLQTLRNEFTPLPCRVAPNRGSLQKGRIALLFSIKAFFNVYRCYSNNFSLRLSSAIFKKADYFSPKLSSSIFASLQSRSKE